MTIVIPTKNEEENIGVLLHTIFNQTLNKKLIKVIIADANSTDKTLLIVESFKNLIDIEVVEGGLPSKGRNNGAKKATTKYILFIDADIGLFHKNILQESLKLMEEKSLDIATTNIKTLDDRKSKILYGLSNIFQKLSKLHKPYSTGMFMLVERETFEKVGKFDEEVVYAEDYHLSRRFDKKKFGIVKSAVYTPSRRFQKMGYGKIVSMFLKAATGEKQFYNNKGYWD